VDPAKKTMNMTVRPGLSLAMHMYVRRVGASTRFIHFFNGSQEFKMKEATGSFNIFFLGGVGNMAPIPLDQWFTVCITWDAATRVYRFYINGSEVKTGTMGSRVDLTFDSMKIMDTVRSTDDLDLKHVQIHLRELSSADVAAQHAAMAA
jgi:hypothetical protein